jgi:hypothetical protein
MLNFFENSFNKTKKIVIKQPKKNLLEKIKKKKEIRILKKKQKEKIEEN